MRRRCFSALLMCVLIVVFGFSSGFAQDKGEFSTAPKKKADGGKWRVGYLEGGPFINYQMTLIATVKGLEDLGWIEKTTIPTLEDREDTSKLWTWMAENIKSEYIEFVPDAYWSANWDDTLRKEMRSAVLKRLNDKKDIDLMIAMGTWAGQDLANDEHSTPTIVLSTSDPVGANIIESIEDSGYDHVHARVDPTRYDRQIRVFHDIIGFDKLGVAYEDTETGRTYAALGSIKKIAKERGFEVVECHTLSDIPDKQKAFESLLKCHEELAPKIDAMYLTIQGGMTLDKLPQLMEPLNKHKIPTFSQAGTDEVKHGVLLSIAQAGFIYVGKYHAETMAKIFNGAKPRQLSQIFEDPPKIAINLAEAKVIGWDPPVEIYELADEIYEEIEEVK